MRIIIIEDGKIRDENIEELNHGVVRKMIGGYMEAAFRIFTDTDSTLVGWCDDEGHIKGLPFNFWRWVYGSDPIVGKVVVTRERRDEDGTLMGVRASDRDLLRIIGAGTQVVLIPPPRF